jgi:hypothetical protein
MGTAPTPGCIPPDKKTLHDFREYMLTVQGALKDPPSKAKSRLEVLEASRNELCSDARNIIPSPLRINDARTEITIARQSLLTALASN